jgi:predicted ATPase/DNA-binding XRE family transcriptional regulator/AraC-like DNA-binding protein
MNGDERLSFGALLRKHRLATGLSQESLAARARLSTEAIGALERGTRKSPQRQTLALLIDALELEAGDREELAAAAVKPSGPRHITALQHSNLPLLLTRFVGRAHETDRLEHLVRDRKLVTITGVGGVGKTRMAVELGRSIAGRFPDGVWLIQLAALREGRLLAQTIASALAIPDVPGRPVLGSILEALRAQSLLLIIDNCEHVIDDAARTIAALLASCSDVSIVATSREPLRIDGEVVFRLPTLAQSPAVELFVQGARAASPGFASTDRDDATIASICRHLDGIPLAIELASAKVSAFTVDQIADNLNERFALLRGGARTALPRQQTLRALIDWSFDLLSHAERSFLAALSVFSGSFTIEAAAFVCLEKRDDPDAFIILASLVDKSLVAIGMHDQPAHRYSLLETVRLYAWERLEQAGACEATLARHAAFMLAFAQGVAASLESTYDERWHTHIGPEIDNIRHSLDWSLAQKHDIALGAELAAVLGPYWESHGYGEGKRWLAAAGDVAEMLDARIAARIFLEYVRTLPFDEHTIELSEGAVRAYRDVDDPAGLCRALEYRAQTLINIGRYDEAARALIESEGRAADAGYAVGMARLETLNGFADLYARRTDEAERRFRKAEALMPAHAHPRELALVARGFAEVALVRNAPDVAIEHSRRALQVLTGRNNVRVAGAARYHLAHCLLASGRAEEASQAALQAIQELGETQASQAFAEAVTILAAAYVQLGRHEQAATLLPFLHAQSNGPFCSPYLIVDLRNATLSALEARMGNAAFAAARSSHAQLDERTLVETTLLTHRTLNYEGV